MAYLVSNDGKWHVEEREGKMEWMKPHEDRHTDGAARSGVVSR